MKRTFSIVFGIVTLILPLVSLLFLACGYGWEGMKLIGLWAMVATVFAIKG